MHIKRMINNIAKTGEEVKMEELSTLMAKCIYDFKELDYKKYKWYELELHRIRYGYHFTKDLVEEVTSEMINNDGTVGTHWTIKETNDVVKSYNVDMSTFNEFDFNYTMNMIYSDYYGTVSNDVGTYCKMSLAFLNDKDGCEGKALIYYINVAKK